MSVQLPGTSAGVGPLGGTIDGHAADTSEIGAVSPMESSDTSPALPASEEPAVVVVAVVGAVAPVLAPLVLLVPSSCAAPLPDPQPSVVLTSRVAPRRDALMHGAMQR